MEAEPQRPKGRDGAHSALNTAIEALNPAEKTSSIPPVKAVLGSVKTLLTMIRVRFPLFYHYPLQVHTTQGSTVDELDHVELGLFCADICQTLGRGTNGRRPGELNQTVYEAINLLNVWVEPATYISNRPLKCSGPQDPDRGSEEASQVG